MRFIPSDVQFVCFAPIDLKLADVYIYDGFSVSGVTNSAEEPQDETTVALTGCGEIVPVGCRVTFGNDSIEKEYSIASRTTSGGTNAVFSVDLDGATGGTFALTYKGSTTNAIAFDAVNATIQLELEALDTIGNGDVLVEAGGGIYEFKVTFQDDLASLPISLTEFVFDGALLTGGGGTDTMVITTPGVLDTSTDTITLTEGLAEVVEIDGTVTFRGLRLEVKVGEGNVNWTETMNRDYIKDRGNLDTVRNADQEPVDVKFEFTWEWITAVTGSGVPTLEDALKKRGEASTWETTDSDVCAPYCVDIIIWYDPGCGGNNTEKITLPYFRYETLEHNIRDSQISCSGKCNVIEATAVRI